MNLYVRVYFLRSQSVRNYFQKPPLIITVVYKRYVPQRLSELFVSLFLSAVRCAFLALSTASNERLGGLLEIGGRSVAINRRGFYYSADLRLSLSLKEWGCEVQA